MQLSELRTLKSSPVSMIQRRVLSERNVRQRLTTSAQRRHEAIQLRISKEKLRRRRMVRKLEYQRLRTMVPSIAKRPLVSKVTVIEEAIRYIDYLHEALLLRLRTKGLPSCLQGVNVDVNQLSHEDIKNLVCQLVETNNKTGGSQAPLIQRHSNRSSSGQKRPRTRQTRMPFPVRQKRT